MGFKDMSATEELLTICHWKHTRCETEDFFNAFLWDLLTRQNCCSSIGVGDIATKLSPFSTWKAPLARTRFWHCKMTLRSKPDKYPLILESIQCSGNYWWRRSIPVSEDVQHICANLLSRTWKSPSPSTDQRWLITTL